MPYGVYGLNRNGWYDERFDPEKSTHAYARYMKDAVPQLGDWYLAMAAYDWGPGNVQKRGGAHRLRRLLGTVPPQRASAGNQELRSHHHRRRHHGEESAAVWIAVLMPDPPLLTDKVTTNYSVDLRLVSDVVGAPVQEISDLNPSLLRMSTPADGPFELHLPAGQQRTLREAHRRNPRGQAKSMAISQSGAGETLETVAHDYHVSASEIVFVNQLEADDNLSSTDSLIIPVPPAPSSKSRITLYKVEHGDTLVTVADRFNITVQQLRRWNHLTAAHLEPGRRLYVAEPAHVDP